MLQELPIQNSGASFRITEPSRHPRSRSSEALMDFGRDEKYRSGPYVSPSVLSFKTGAFNHSARSPRRSPKASNPPSHFLAPLSLSTAPWCTVKPVPGHASHLSTMDWLGFVPCHRAISPGTLVPSQPCQKVLPRACRRLRSV
jgi:hypothetical protein